MLFAINDILLTSSEDKNSSSLELSDNESSSSSSSSSKVSKSTDSSFSSKTIISSVLLCLVAPFNNAGDICDANSLNSFCLFFFNFLRCFRGTRGVGGASEGIQTNSSSK